MNTKNELRKIFKVKGADGLLPQNLPDELINDFAKRLLEFTVFNFKYGKKMDENLISFPNKDIIQSIIFLTETLTRITTGDNSYKITNDEFQHGFKCIRKHYGLENFRRTNETALKKPNYTVETILDDCF